MRVEGAVPPIIDKETWDTVRVILNGRKSGPRVGGTRTYILSGLLYCKDCGSAMVGHCSTKTNRKGEKIRYHYYECNQVLRTRTCDNKRRYPADQLEKAVLGILDCEFSQHSDKLIELLFQSVCDYHSSISEQEKNVTSRLKNIERKMEHIIQAIEDGVDYTALAPKLGIYRAEKESLANEMQDLKANCQTSQRDRLNNMFCHKKTT